MVPGTSAKTLQGFIGRHVQEGSTVYTDDHSSYIGIPYKHMTVNHSAREFVNRMAHTNGIESFWALLKRGYYGIYHQMSVKHLPHYINEFSFRHNTARDGTIAFIESIIRKIESRRLTYEDLIDATI